MATQKQKIALSKMVGNGGNITKAMKEAGYSDATANTPGKLTKSIGFQELMDEMGMTDDFLLEKHMELLNAKSKGGRPDTFAVKAGLEMGYKLKGSFAPDKSEMKLKMVPIMGGKSVKEEKED